ncbi:MAG: LytR C-terminal domain-containing protein [Propionibacteriaceae bacterium]|jgi:hypothetical protein|nr:LytR C-terminal domain-containing protein [Propionibacteriaceae bacterium]
MNAKQVRHMLSTPITLVILLALLVAGAVWGFKAVTAKVPAPQPANCVTQPMTQLTTGSVTVNVYNGGNIRGRAAAVAEKLASGGFIIGKTDNTEERVLTVIVTGAATDSPEVQLVAAWFNTPEVKADARPDHSVDVLIGDDYNPDNGMAATPPAALEIPSGEVCLPPSATPAPSETAAEPPTDQPT